MIEYLITRYEEEQMMAVIFECDRCGRKTDVLLKFGVAHEVDRPKEFNSVISKQFLKAISTEVCVACASSLFENRKGE